MAPTSFPQFANLPAELQLQIWDSTTATLPGTMQMHLFDVHAPSPPTPSSSLISTTTITPAQKARLRQRTTSPSPTRVRKSTSPQRDSRHHHQQQHSHPYQQRSAARLETVTLEAFHHSSSSSSSSGNAGKVADPSAYRLRHALRATCTDAAAAAHRAQHAIPPRDRAVVELPSGHTVEYDNGRDVLHLRFRCRSSHTTAEEDRSSSSPPSSPAAAAAAAEVAPLSAIFRALWSRPLAAALHGARRLAIDVSQIWPELPEEQSRLAQDIVFLACTVQHDLEVLYLVDYSSSSSTRITHQRTTAGAAAAAAAASPSPAGPGRRDGDLYTRLHYPTDAGWERERARPADIIHGGGGTVWREVFDLEALGWHERHPGFVFGEMFGEVVRLQQANWYGQGDKKATFQGVRVLVAEDE